MTRTHHTPLVWLLAILATSIALDAHAEVTMENSRARLIISEDARWRSLADKATGRELIPEGVALPVAEVVHGGKRFAAARAAADGDALTISFADTDTVLTYAFERAGNWIVLRLRSVAGTRPESMTLLQLPVAITKNVGTRLNVAWDDETAVCMMAATRQTDCRGRAGRHAVLSASTQDSPGPELEGAAAAIIVSPTSQLKTIAREASHAFGLLTNEDADGTPVKDTELVRGSYWFLSFGEDEVDRVIDYSNRSGIRQVMLSSGAWCVSPGHYLFHEGRYPNGQAGLKAMIAKLHEHGILVGMHTFASKISKRDPYVTPVPDPRLLRGVSASWRPSDGLLETTLHDAVTAEQTEIRVAGNLQFWPGSSAVADRYWEGGLDKHLEVTIGNEIVRYESIGPEGVWNTFEGCRRGAWGTTAAAHPAGAGAFHVGVDGCINGYIIDQETDLMDEVADRLAGIFNDCGFDMVYFDGGEDVDRRRFNYYVSNFQEQAVKRFTKRPVIHMGTVMNHLLWHSFARSSTVDQYLSTLGGAIIGGRAPTKWPTVKEHIDRSVRYMLSVRQDMMPGELGWFGIWPRGTRTYTVTLSEDDARGYRELGCGQGPVELPSRENTVMTGELISPTELRLRVEYDGLQLDEIEYLMCKSLGYDVPISLQTGFAQLEAHGLSPEILNIVREYEAMRMQRVVPGDTRAKLQELGKDFARVRLDGRDRWVEVQRVDELGDTRELRAMVGPLDGGSVATLWHTLQDGHLALKLPPEAVRVVDFMGKALPAETDGDRVLVPVDSTRTTLICPALTPEQLRDALQAAELRLRQPAQVWLRTADFDRLVGEMSLGSDVGVHEPDAFGDVLVATGRPSVKKPEAWFAEYTVDIPRDGLWAIWGRVRYPRGSDDSFGFVVPGEEVTLSHGDGQVLGNCGVDVDRWHWTGRGAGSTAVPPGQPLTRRLESGPFTFRIYAREGPGNPQTNPQLDLICLTEDPAEVPTDEEARAWLDGK
ncbi:MAG: hypothetical protein RBS80_23255 [Thermoguttaceae bacterium]|jgi:hypothetical protein|nr:hypothetical protein [Thermoguttaceae bacterium]